MGVAASIASQGSSLSAVRRGDLRRQSQIIADESISTVGVATPSKKQGKNANIFIENIGNLILKLRIMILESYSTSYTNNFRISFPLFSSPGKQKKFFIIS